MFEEALARFRTALDYWCRADYPYGAAAAYANIGNTYLSSGNQKRAARLTAEARSRYRRAVEWLARCLEFGAGACLGDDTSEAQAALAEAFLGLDERDRALGMARAGRDAAQQAGNQLDLASALSVMASLLWLKGNRREASACAEDAAARFDQLGHPARALKIRQSLKKGSSFPPIRKRIACRERRVLSRTRLFRRRERDMSFGRSPGLPLYQLLDVPAARRRSSATRRGPTDAELRGIGVFAVTS